MKAIWKRFIVSCKIVIYCKDQIFALRNLKHRSDIRALSGRMSMFEVQERTTSHRAAVEHDPSLEAPKFLGSFGAVWSQEPFGVCWGYSIASSPLMHPDKIQLCVVLVDWTVESTNELRLGEATGGELPMCRKLVDRSQKHALSTVVVICSDTKLSIYNLSWWRYWRTADDRCTDVRAISWIDQYVICVYLSFVIFPTKTWKWMIGANGLLLLAIHSPSSDVRLPFCPKAICDNKSLAPPWCALCARAPLFFPRRGDFRMGHKND